MLHTTNTHYHQNMKFEEYLTLPGYSYSGLKAKSSPFPDQPTAKMWLGTKVHNYLLEPEKYNHEDREIVKPMALAVRNVLGPELLGLMEKELVVTCDMECGGFTMPYKGRLDMCRVGRIVIDLKVSTMPLHRSIPFFGYDKQLSGYAIATGSRVALIVKVDPRNCKPETKIISIQSEWWERQVLKYGQPKAN